MDLHRAAFKMENSSYLPNPLASPALMVLASTAEASRDASIPCQQPRPFGVPVSVDKDVHIPFTNGSYTFASMYHRQGGVPGTFANRDFPPFLTTPPPPVCPPKSRLHPNQYAKSQWRGGIPSLRFHGGQGELSVSLYASQETQELSRLRVSPPALLRCRWQGI
ncbi:rCG50260 [Rattus norvegicus]|uniref:RCG50260 n=1 Tax=Rattus norvegicus TaxID=10116 RepID=A6JZD8_RAT|nr:rCG50260 [Rattus norvegicus]